MPDPLLSAAIREAYASVPEDLVIYHTLELWHPDFTVPVRVVRDRDPLDARLEATAPRDPGAVVTFAAYAFEFSPPELTSTGVPQATIEIDNVDSAIERQLALASTSALPVTVIYRAYLSDALDDGPENDPPVELTLTSATATPFRVRATAGFPDLLNAAFPRGEYTLDRFPGLSP